MILAKKNNEKFPHSLTTREDEIGATDGFRSAIDIAGKSPARRFSGGSFKDGNGSPSGNSPSRLSRKASFSVQRAVASLGGPLRRTSSSESEPPGKEEEHVRFRGVLYKMVTATDCNSWHERLVTITEDAIIFQKFGDGGEKTRYVMDAIPLLEITECSRVLVEEDAQNVSTLAQLDDGMKETKPKRKGFRKGGFRASSIRQNPVATQSARSIDAKASAEGPTKYKYRSTSVTAVQQKITRAKAAFSASFSPQASVASSQQWQSAPQADAGSLSQMTHAPSVENLAVLPLGKSKLKLRQRLSVSYPASSDAREHVDWSPAGTREQDASSHEYESAVDVARLADDLNAPVISPPD